MASRTATVAYFLALSHLNVHIMYWYGTWYQVSLSATTGVREAAGGRRPAAAKPHLYYYGRP